LQLLEARGPIGCLLIVGVSLGVQLARHACSSSGVVELRA